MTYEERLAEAEVNMDFCQDYHQERLRLWEYAERMKDEAREALDAARREVDAAWDAPCENTDD